MTYKSLLVPIGTDADNDRRIAVAAKLAAEHGAQVTGLAIVQPLELPQRLRSHPGARAILKEEFEKSAAAAQELARAFPEKARAHGAGDADAMVVEAEPTEALASAAHSADLVVLSQPAEDDLGALGTHFVEQAITACARPVLIVPRGAVPGSVGRKALVAWKSTQASARALADARPILERSSEVTVLAVREDGKGGRSEDARRFMERHGIAAKFVEVEAPDAGEAILDQARALGADLIVMGAFARPRLSEMLAGGATRTVLQKMASCVLMSH